MAYALGALVLDGLEKVDGKPVGERQARHEVAKGLIVRVVRRSIEGVRFERVKHDREDNEDAQLLRDTASRVFPFLLGHAPANSAEYAAACHGVGRDREDVRP